MAVQKYSMLQIEEDLNDKNKILGVDYDIREILKHELKTPLNSNIVMLNLLLNNRFGSLNDEQKEILVNIISSSEYALLTMNNVLIYENIKNLKILQAKEKHNVESIIKSVVCDLDLIFKDKKQNISIKCEYNDLYVDVDIIEIKRVLYNLIVNLAELSEEGSEHIISIQKNKNFIEICFQNKTYKNKYFYTNKKDKFRKITTDLKFDICKKIVKLHNGKININPFRNFEYAYKITLNTEK